MTCISSKCPIIASKFRLKNLINYLFSYFLEEPLEQKHISLESKADIQRAHEMEQLESDIVQVNELFTTLATYIHDQGTLVDSIGDNIEVAYEQVGFLQFMFIKSLLLRDPW